MLGPPAVYNTAGQRENHTFSRNRHPADRAPCVRTRVDKHLYCNEEGGAMGKFLDYSPEQAYLPPPSVRDVLVAGHLCFLFGA